MASTRGSYSLPSLLESLALFILKLMAQRHINLTPLCEVGGFVSPFDSFDYQLESLPNYSDHGAYPDLIIKHGKLTLLQKIDFRTFYYLTFLRSVNDLRKNEFTLMLISHSLILALEQKYNGAYI